MRKKRLFIFVIILISLIVCIIVSVFVILFAELSALGDTVYYNGSLYDKIINWYPNGKAVTIDKAWFGDFKNFPQNGEIKGNKKIELYDGDPDAIFFYTKSWLLDNFYFHKKDDILPKPYDENAVIVLEIDEKANVNIEGEVLNNFKQFIKKCLTEPNNVLKHTNDDIGLASIKVFYKDYPAYNCFGYLGMSGDKVVMFPLTKSNEYAYFVLPDGLAEQIKQLIEIK